MFQKKFLFTMLWEENISSCIYRDLMNQPLNNFLCSKEMSKQPYKWTFRKMLSQQLFILVISILTQWCKNGELNPLAIPDMGDFKVQTVQTMEVKSASLPSILYHRISLTSYVIKQMRKLVYHLFVKFNSHPKCSIWSLVFIIWLMIRIQKAYNFDF